MNSGTNMTSYGKNTKVNGNEKSNEKNGKTNDVIEKMHS